MQFDHAAARAWLDGIPGGKLGDDYQSQWEKLASSDKPVLTLYGAYDTGKSSLLRRLIIDSGGEVPDWLTISARHETFEVNETQLSGCVVRDTPGFVPGGSDVRADNNTALATEAVSLTDVGIVVLTPQLATAEYSALQQLVNSGWARGSLWFVISRFDEAGIDPESDLVGYRELAQRKSAELREALDLGSSFPIFVVCQDFAQMAGAERTLESSFWDGSREWDGMDALHSAISELGRSGGTSLRDAACRRFWTQAVTSTLNGLEREVSGYAAHLQVCDEGRQLRDSWLAQLESIRAAAEADLRGKIGEIVVEASHDPVAARLIGDRLTTAVDFWFRDQERQVDKLLQTVEATASTERERPSWKGLADLASSVRAKQSRVSSAPKKEDQLFTPAVGKVAIAVQDAFLEYRKLGRLKSVASDATRNARASFEKSAIAATAVFAVELAGLAEKFFARRAKDEEKEAERKRLEAELNRIGQEAANVALENLEPLLHEARDAIQAATADQMDMREGVLGMMQQLQEHVATGRPLVGEA